MKLWTVLSPEHILPDVVIKDKDALLRFIAENLVRFGKLRTPDTIYESLKKREEIMSTGIGGGIAIPHAFSSEVEAVTLLFIRLKRSIPFQALDGRPVDVVIPIIVPGNETSLHLQALGAVSGLCRRPGFLKNMRISNDSKKMWDDIRAAEEKGHL